MRKEWRALCLIYEIVLYYRNDPFASGEWQQHSAALASSDVN